MSKPNIYLGAQGLSTLLALDPTARRDAPGYDYNLLALTNRAAPAGVGGECIFPALYFVTVHTAAVALFVTVLVDNVALETQRLDLPAAALDSVTAHELGLSVPVLVDGAEVGRVYPRGTWAQVRVETRFDNAAYMAAAVAVDGIEIEHEVVRETKQPSGVTL